MNVSRRRGRPGLLWAGFVGLVMAGWLGNAQAALKDGAVAPDFTAPAALAATNSASPWLTR